MLLETDHHAFATLARLHAEQARQRAAERAQRVAALRRAPRRAGPTARRDWRDSRAAGASPIPPSPASRTHALRTRPTGTATAGRALDAMTTKAALAASIRAEQARQRAAEIGQRLEALREARHSVDAAPDPGGAPAQVAATT
jgi:hypothetical protein